MRRNTTSPRPFVSKRNAKQVRNAAIATVAILTGPIYAQNINWDNGAAEGSPLWTTAANWAGDVLPGVNNTAVFNVNAATTISLNNTTQEIAGFLFNQGSAYKLVSGGATPATSLLILNAANQTGNVSNEVQVPITTKNGGLDLLTSNVTQNSLQLQQKITSGGITKTGNGTLRLGTSGTNFDNAINGNIVINGGTFQASAGDVAGVNNPLAGTGNITIGAANVTVSLTHGNASPSATYDFGRDIIANNNSFTLNVNRAAGTQTGRVSQAGVLTIGNATVNVTGDAAYQARLDGVTILSGATTILNVNNNGSNAGGNHLTIDSLIGDATTVLRKNGGQNLTINENNPSNFTGRLELNGGTTTIRGTAANRPTAAGITYLSNSNLNLRADENVDFASDITFGPGVLSQAISVDRISTTGGTGKTLSVGTIDLTDGRTFTANSGNSFILGTDGLIVSSGTGTLVGNASVTANQLTTAAGTTFNKLGGGTLTINGDNSAISSAAINIRAGSVTGTVAGSLGTGSITVGNTTPNTAGFLPDTARLNWNAAGASAKATGIDAIAIAGGVIDLNANPAVTDVFDIQADGRIQGTTSQLQSLTVGTNVTLAPNAIVVHENPSATANATITSLSNNADLFYGIAATANSLPTIGVGTPWKGIAGDNTAARTIQGAAAGEFANILINGGDNNPATIEATLQTFNDQALNFGTTTGGDGGITWTSTAAAGEKVTLAIRSTIGVSNLGLVPGGRVIFNEAAADNSLAATVDKIVIQSGALALLANNSLGGVPVEVQSGGSLDIGGSTGLAIDGDVTVRNGGVLFLNDNLLISGSGAITIEGGGKLDITGGAPANILTASTQQINFTGTGHTVRFAADNIEELDQRITNTNVTYVVAGGVATTGNFPGTTINAPSLNSQTTAVLGQTPGLTIENGILTNDGTTRAFTGPLRLNDTNFTIAASRNTNFIVTSDISTTGNLQIGSLTAIDGRDKSSNAAATNWAGVQDPYNLPAQVVLMGAVSANNVTVNNSHLAFGNANTTITGDLTVNGGALYLDGGGPIASGATAGQLTSKLAAGTVAGRIILGPNTRSEMKVDLASDSNATVLEINQPFVMEGDINPQDNRRFWISRNSGSNTRVNLNDVTLNNGSVFGVQEDNTDVRASLKLAGNATVSTPSANTNIDYINISRDASLPAFDGTNPVVLTQGRLNMTGWQGSNVTNSNVFGTLGAGVQVDIIRGQLFFQAGSTVNGVVRTQTAAAGGDSFVISSSGSSTNTFNTDTTIGGTGRIELGRSAAANGPEDFEVRGTEITNATAAQAPLHTHAGEIRVVNDGNNSTIDGVVRSNRNNDSDRTARVKVDNVVLESGATVQLASGNGIPLTVGNVTLQGNGTIDTLSTGMTVNAVNAGTNAVTFTGAQALNLTGAVTASQINVNNTNLNFPAGLNSTLNVNGGNATVPGDVTGAVNVTSGTATVNGNVTGGLSVTTGGVSFNAGGGTKTVTGPVSLDAGNIAVANGTLDFGNTVITSTAESVVAGLREMRAAGAFNITAPNDSNIVELGPVMAQTNAGWGTNETYIYTGQFFVPNNNGDGTGTFAFAESFDDSVRVVIDGTQYLSNPTFNDSTGTGAVTLSTGWHDVEFRFGQGTGGVGPVNADGWNGTLAFGLDLDNSNGIDTSTTSPVQSQYVAPLDNGTMNLFRSTIASNLSIGADSVLRAGGLTGVGKITLAGVNSNVVLNATAGPAVLSSTGSIEVSASASGRIEVTRAGDKLTAANAKLNGDLTIAGAGDVTLNGGATGAGSVIMDGTGLLLINGPVEGATFINSGTLSGSGTFSGGITVGDGEIAPGQSPGILTTSTLTASNASLFQFEIGSALLAGAAQAGVDFDQIVLSGDSIDLGSSTLSLVVSSALKSNDVFTLILNNGTDFDPGVFSGFANGSLIDLPNGYQVQLSYFDDAAQAGLQLAGGNDVSVMVTIPEPSAALALLGGLASLAGMRRFRRRQA